MNSGDQDDSTWLEQALLEALETTTENNDDNTSEMLSHVGTELTDKRIEQLGSLKKVKDFLRMQIRSYEKYGPTYEKFPKTNTIILPENDRYIFCNDKPLSELVIDFNKVGYSMNKSKEGTDEIKSHSINANSKDGILVYKLLKPIDLSTKDTSTRNSKESEDQIIENNYKSSFISEIASKSKTDNDDWQNSGYIPIASCNNGRARQSKYKSKRPKWTNSFSTGVSNETLNTSNQQDNPSYSVTGIDNVDRSTCINMASVILKNKLLCSSCADLHRRERSGTVQRARSKKHVIEISD
ncbi:uncharacterized protein L201_007676 [Kwoniella dendrophila CBS 6074]|uniref:Uncharacterized protein n=1 Tax=Kwoniella dendrophila CBS 6074 TaxID=1295534 RepID=A0AAX4K508_9TREE